MSQDETTQEIEIRRSSYGSKIVSGNSSDFYKVVGLYVRKSDNKLIVEYEDGM